MGGKAKQLEPGDRVGRFLILERLGQGTSGTVYLAEDTVLEAKVALKTVDARASSVSTARFKREILLARSIVHPGVCRVFDLHEEQDLLFLTMEFIPGETLEAILARDGRLGVNRSLRVVRDIAQAVAAAHAIGIIHRDLKPANIVLALGRQPTVLDFGCATAPSLAQITRVGQFVGTARYLAPEILCGRAEATEAADLYALAVILYRCLTGRYQYRAKTFEELRTESEKQPPPPSRLAPEVGEALDAVLMRAMALDPAKRYPTAQELEHALAAVAEQTAPKPVALPEESSSPWDGDIERTVTAVVDFFRDETLGGGQETFTTVLFSEISEIGEFFATHGNAAGKRRIEEHNEIVFGAIRAHGGTLIKTASDAVMASFAAAQDGVDAAIAMQRAVAGFNLDHYDDPLSVRIGVNSGTAVLDGSELFGDAVRVAARVAGRAGPDQIFITGATRAKLTAADVPIRRQASQRPLGVAGESHELHAVVWGPQAQAGAATGRAGGASPRSVSPGSAASPRSVVGRSGRDSAKIGTPGARLGRLSGRVSGKVETPGGRSERNSAKVEAPAGRSGRSPASGEAPAGRSGRSPTSGEAPVGRSGRSPTSGEAPAGRSPLGRARVESWGLPSPDAPSGPGGSIADNERCVELLGDLEETLIAKGLYPGDDERLDRTLDTAARQLAQGKKGPGVRFLEFAGTRAEEVDIDGAFVTAKLGRLERALSDARVDPLNQEALTIEINDLRKRRAFFKANEVLNQALAELGGGGG